MRTLIVLTLILAVFLGLSTWGYYHIDATARNLTGHITKTEKAVADSNWPAARREISLMSTEWRKTKPVWSLFVDHHEMDNIDTVFARVRQVLTAKDPAETRAGLGELMRFIQHIPEKEALTLENIL